MKVKQQLNPNLEYQHKAIKSIVDIFKDVKFDYKSSDNFNVIFHNLFSFNDSYISNCNPIISNNQWNDIILKNINDIRFDNNLDEIQYIYNKQPIFDVEMETGTGKTYVYLRTILELHKKYSYKKFIILVPNKAVKETIQSNLRSYEEHFNSIYNGVNYNFNYYDSKSIDIIKVFNESTNLEILIMNIQQINKFDEKNKSKNNIYKYSDELQSSRAIDLIRNTNPILIIDEPQTTASGEKSIKAISDLNSPFMIRYSATFRKRKDEILMYKLDAVDAYNLNLVKHIEVLGLDDNDNEDIKIISLDNKKNLAQVSLEYWKNKEKKFKNFKITRDSDLYEITKNDKYIGWIVEEINFKENEIIFANGKKILKGVTYDINIKSSQIKSTIEKHLDRQLVLLDKNIKVLSLFFIDKVSNYRIYKEGNKSLLGEYGKIFENSLREILTSNEKYLKIIGNKTIDEYIKSCHDGYFSKDSKGRFIDSAKGGDSENDLSTYEQIMKDKEGLLSFDKPLSFIFSHTALKEGWDNPNVFQICTLNETTSREKMHQEVGRGLRLCVDQDGKRIEDTKINILTVIINFSYKEFTTTLQREMEENGVDFGKLSINSFVFKDKESNVELIDNTKSKEIYKYLVEKGVIDKKTEKLNQIFKNDDKNIKTLLINKFNLGNDEIYNQIIKKLLCSISRELKVTNAKHKIKNSINYKVMESKEFKSIWENIKFKSKYNIVFKEKEFVNNVIDSLQRKIDISNEKKSIIFTKSSIKIDRDIGITTYKETIHNSYKYDNNSFSSDILTIVSSIEKETNLKRSTIVDILTNDKILNILTIATSKILKILLEVIKYEKRKMIYKYIEYEKINESYNLDQFKNDISIYKENELIYKIQNEDKYLYSYIDTDSKIEREFAKDSDESELVKMFIKLPLWYKIKTPYNTYNPDWSLLLKNTDLISVVETKGSTDYSSLREIENEKITCAKRHFEAISNNVEYRMAKNLIELLKK